MLNSRHRPQGLQYCLRWTVFCNSLVEEAGEKFRITLLRCTFPVNPCFSVFGSCKGTSPFWMKIAIWLSLLPALHETCQGWQCSAAAVQFVKEAAPHEETEVPQTHNISANASLSLTGCILILPPTISLSLLVFVIDPREQQQGRLTGHFALY